MVCPIIASGSCTLEAKHVSRLFLLTKLTEALGHLQVVAYKAAASRMFVFPASEGMTHSRIPSLPATDTTALPKRF